MSIIRKTLLLLVGQILGQGQLWSSLCVCTTLMIFTSRFQDVYDDSRNPIRFSAWYQRSGSILASWGGGGGGNCGYNFWLITFKLHTCSPCQMLQVVGNPLILGHWGKDRCQLVLFEPITFKLHTSVERTNPIDLGRVQGHAQTIPLMPCRYDTQFKLKHFETRNASYLWREESYRFLVLGLVILDWCLWNLEGMIHSNLCLTTFKLYKTIVHNEMNPIEVRSRVQFSLCEKL